MIVTHDPRVRTIADRVVTIRDGRLTHDGEVEPMSATMILGRVVLPASAVLLAIVLAWQSVQTYGRASGRDAATGRGRCRPRGGRPPQRPAA